MKRWVITADANEDVESLRKRMTDHGATVDDEPPIPLGPAEQVLKAQGPDDLPERLKQDPGVHDVFPDSDVELLEPSADSGLDASSSMAMDVDFDVSSSIDGAAVDDTPATEGDSIEADDSQ